jgi:hypothetical protein
VRSIAVNAMAPCFAAFAKALVKSALARLRTPFFS